MSASICALTSSVTYVSGFHHHVAGSSTMPCGSNTQVRSPVISSRTSRVVSTRSRLFDVATTAPGAARTAGTAREAVAIPYDGAMSGRPLTHDSLAPATRRAWLHAAAALARGLDQQ